MKRGIYLFLIILLLNPTALAVNLNNSDELTEKDLIESCKFPSSGPDVVLQKTKQGDILIWLYEPNKEEFGDLIAIKPINIEKINENKYSFKLGNNQEYIFEATIPNYCTRPKETTSQRASTQEEIVHIDGRCNTASANIPGDPSANQCSCFIEQKIEDTRILTSSIYINEIIPYVNTGRVYGACPDSKRWDIPVPTTEPTINTDNQGTTSNINTQSQQAIAEIFKQIFERIFGFLKWLFESIIALFTLQPSIENDNPLWSGDQNNPQSSTSTTSSSTTEEKCNIEGTFIGGVDSQDIDIFVDVKDPAWGLISVADVNTHIKSFKKLEIVVNKQDKAQLCGVPSKVRYYVKSEGSLIQYLGKTSTVAGLREANLLEIKEGDDKLYDLVRNGILGGGGVLVKMNNERKFYNFQEKKYDNPSYTLVEKKIDFRNLIESKKGEMSKGDWQTYEFEIIFELDYEGKVKATIYETLKDNKGKIFIKKENTKTISEINIEDYKEYINSLINLIKSASEVFVFEGDVSTEDGGYVIINGGGYEINKNNIGSLNEKEEVPQVKDAISTKIIIKNEKVEKESLNDYLKKQK